MFIGHYAVALAAKKYDRKTNLGVYFLACQFLDLIWPIFGLLGLEQARIVRGMTAINDFDFIKYPYSHSLVASLFWSAVVGGVYFYFSKRKNSALLVGLVVFSHWILDFITHRPDMPVGLSEDTLKLGLGLWNSLPATLIVECGMYASGVFMYVKSCYGDLSKKQKTSFVILASMLFVFYLVFTFGPRPPLESTTAAIAGPALALWLIVFWASKL